MVGKTYEFQYTKENSSCTCFRKKTSTSYTILHSKEKTMEHVCNRIKAEFIGKDENERIVKQQSKLTFNWIQKSYTFCDSYTFRQNEVIMDKMNQIWFAILQLSKVLL